ncbi:unnamed protein product [Leptidea sinapis]|uniref:Peptide transporter family 1 n=1 Tax=Leptidea sinapis TaxID=189913 RepID=A0A5E4PKM5_9NEOP|nr:unnamed protein product [Leptidea sinapis]
MEESAVTQETNLLAPCKRKLPYPKAVGFIITNEFCERFSYYGMRAILALYIRDKLGYTEHGATIVYHTFTMFAYFFPLIGAMIADGWLGKFRTIFYLSLVYATGSILISLTAMPPINIPKLEFTIISLLLIAFGTGGIKPCVSAFGGDQFKLPEQEKYLGYYFSLFYFAINAGSLISTFITPIFRADVHCFGENDCYSLAFGVPGILMVLSILFFVAGKRMYIVKQPSGNILGKVSSCIGGSRWTFQADRMEQSIGGWTLKADQMQVLNPLLILVFIPIFEVAIYPFLHWCKLVRKPLHKMIWGGLLTALSFVISGIVEVNLLPTYGTPVSEGLGQLRVYNGFNCDFNLSIPTGLNDTETFIVGPLSVYEKLDIETKNFIDLPYSLSGQEHTECANQMFDGNFLVNEKTANSFFITNGSILNFTDNNDKAIDGVSVRFLTNVRNIVQVQIYDAKKNKTRLTLPSNDNTQKSIIKGVFNVMIDDIVVIPEFKFETGAVYTINVANVVMITPPNSIHILWLVPQYVIMTMGEVMFSVTGLEFSFTQAPASMKSVLQSFWLLTVAFGNLIVVFVVEGNFLDAQWKEFFLFAGLMLVDMLIFTLMAFRYKYVNRSSSTEELAIEEIRLPEKGKIEPTKDN